MANNKKPSFRLRLASAIAGRSTKSFIPQLTPFDGDSLWDGAARLNDYKTKPSQIQANVGWSFTANTAIVDPCAAVKLKLYRKKKDGDREEIVDHEILTLLDEPNFAHTGEQLRQLHHTYMNFTGESYILMVKNGTPFTPAKGKLPDALQLLPAHLVNFELGETYTRSRVKLGNDSYQLTSIIRDLNPDPGNPYLGRSIIAAASATIDMDDQMKQWNRRLFANNARPSLIFSTNQEVSDESFKRWKQQFEDEHTGTDAAYKPLLIENGDAKPYMLNAQDLDFLAGREFSRDEILAMWRTPSAVIGATSDFNRANMDAAFYIHTTINVVPRVRQFVKQLNATLVRVFDPSLELDFENPVPEDKEIKLKEAGEGVNKWLTIDEVRDLYGQEELPDGLGKQIYGQTSWEPLQSIVDNPRPVAKPADPNSDTTDPNGDANVDDVKPQAGKSQDGVKKKT